jgi:hypothetical protein
LMPVLIVEASSRSNWMSSMEEYFLEPYVERSSQIMA